MANTKFETTDKIYRKMSISHLMYQWGWNYERRQTDGYLFTLTPILKRIYKDVSVEAKERAIKRHLKFFNTHATLVPLLFGLTAVLEVNTPENEKGSMISIKTGLTGPTAGLGDGLFWSTLRPICASIGVTTTVTDNIFGAIFTFVVFSTLSRGMKWFGFRTGYTKGMEIINSGSGGEIIKGISGVVTILGLCVAGYLVSTTVKVNVPLVFASGKEKIVIQELIDKIVPCSLPVLVTIFCYWRLKKTNGKEAILLIFGTMTIPIDLTYLGILGQSLQGASTYCDHGIVPLRPRNILERGFVNEP